MGTNTDILSSRVLKVDDYLPLSDLSLDRAIAALPKELRSNYATAWRWFMQKSGTIGSRMLGDRIPGVTDDFPISAQRGIHVPAKSGIALSVTVKRGSIYSATDQPLITLPDKTWVLEYSAHRNNTGGETDGRWNEGLIQCLRLGLPVGVFIQQRGSSYLRYLAFVEEYHPDRNVFTFHGPITEDTEKSFVAHEFAGQVGQALEYSSHASIEELEEDHRRYAQINKALRDGQGLFRKRLMDAFGGKCACTGCGVVETLQAAHILGYRGTRSNAVSNGLLLRADLHLLFDSSLIAIDPDTYRFVTSGRLDGTDYDVIAGRQMRLPSVKELRPSEEYLAAHFGKFRQIEMAS